MKCNGAEMNLLLKTTVKNKKMEEMIKTLYSFALCRLIVALVICAAVLLGVVLGYWARMAQEKKKLHAEEIKRNKITL